MVEPPRKLIFWLLFLDCFWYRVIVEPEHVQQQQSESFHLHLS